MDPWKPGDRVEHATFGTGTVLEFNDQHAVIHFDDHGRRKFASHLVVLKPSATKEGQAKTPSWATARQQTASAPAPVVAAAGIPATIDELIDLARRTVVSEDSLNAFVSTMRKALPGPAHPHVGVLSGTRVQQFQNWLLDENPKWQLTDAQLLAVMRVEYPLATGLVHVGDVDTGLTQIAGIRAHYNRDGHNGMSPASRGLPPSTSYGTF